MRPMGQVRPIAVEVLDHIHGAVLELPAEFGADDVRLHHGVGRSGLAKQLKARPALLLAEIGLPSHAVDVEDHGLLLLLGLCPGLPSARWQPWPGYASDAAQGRAFAPKRQESLFVGGYEAGDRRVT